MSKPILTPDNLPETPLARAKPIRGRFDNKNVSAILEEYYTPEEVKAMHDNGVDKRMVFGVNAYYSALVHGKEYHDANDQVVLPAMPPSHPLEALVIPILAEAGDMSGEVDPSSQNSYSPDVLKGKLLHKYDEIVLGYVALACSAHCRYCYRLDLFNGSTGKGLVKPEELRDYVLEYNRNIAGKTDAKTGEKRYPIREVLLSGGDPMVLTNRKLYAYMAAAAEAGVEIVRIGTKEMAFRPMRFDENLVEMLEQFHAHYPATHVNFVVHFTHPDEMLLRNMKNEYVQDEKGGYSWLPAVNSAVQHMLSLPYVTLENQTPVIHRVNDNEPALRLLHAELRRKGIKPKYLFQCRRIEGHTAFAVPVETAWKLHNDAMKGLSDTERSRLALSTRHGKVEAVTVIDGIPESVLARVPEAMRPALAALFGDGLIIFKIHRSPNGADTQGDIVIARRNPKALWMDGYEDRIIYDGREHDAKAKYGALVSALLPQLEAA